MGLFDKLFKGSSNESSFGFTPKSELEAWVGIYYACAGIDGDVSDAEREILNKYLVFKSWFDTSDPDIVLTPYRKVATAMQSVSSKDIVNNCAPFISEDRKNTLFCFVVEVLMADGILHDSEKDILEHVQHALNIEDEIALKILEVYFMRNDGNIILHD